MVLQWRDVYNFLLDPYADYRINADKYSGTNEDLTFCSCGSSGQSHSGIP